MEGFCRGCLTRYDEPMELLQYTEKNKRLFWYSTGLQIKRDDVMIFQLCKKCFINMKAACNFKKQCRSSDRKLKSYLSLEAVGVAVDFPTFLKNSDDSTTFRPPLVSGNNTPANYNKARDDDNESTCTSIRNFMTDILQDEEVADTEARIIREVIEEEADLMDDTLDSHWLRDENSIDSDFQLYLNFSPFATPHSINNDHYYTPRREESSQMKKYFTSFSPIKHGTTNDVTENIKNNHGEKELCVSNPNNIKKQLDHFSMNISDDEKSSNVIQTKDKIIKSEPILDISIDSEQLNNLNLPTVDNDISISNAELRSFDSLPSIPSIENESMSNLELSKIEDHNKDQGVHVPNFYIPNDATEYIQTCKEIEKIVDGKLNSKRMYKEKPCTIDKNLARALKDENKQEYSLDDLLVSPQVGSGSSTPSITKILYGDNVSGNLIIGGKKSHENFQDLEVIEDIFMNDKKEFDSEMRNEEFNVPMDDDDDEVFIAPKEIKQENPFSIYDEKQFDLANFICNICQRKFDSCKALCIHSAKTHNIKIMKPINKDYISRPRVCQLCGLVFKNLQNFHRHLKRHKDFKSQDKKMKKCFLCGGKSKRKLKIYDFNCATFNNCYMKLMFRRAKHFKYHNINLTKDLLENVGYHGLCYKHVSVLSQKYNEEYLTFVENYDEWYISTISNQINSYCITDDQKDPENSIHKCDHCSIEFSSIYKLKRHKASLDPESVTKKPGKYVCTICGATSTTKGNFRTHQRRHEKKHLYNCDQCGKGFYTKPELTVHRRVHSGEKPFSCSYCKKMFSRKDSLIKHVKIHINDKPFKCEYCNEKFTIKTHLTVHVRESIKCRRKRGILPPKRAAIIEELKTYEDPVLEVKQGLQTELPYIDTEISN